MVLAKARFITPEEVPDGEPQDTIELIKIQDGKYLFITDERILLIQDPQG